MKPQSQPHSYTVREATTLMAFLESIFPGKARNGLKQLLRNGCVAVNGRVITLHSYELSTGQTVDVISGSGARQITEVAGMKLLYEDQDILVVDKPAGLLTVGTDSEKTNTAYSLLSQYVKSEQRGNKVFIVHRLDRDTSGILVFARNTRVRDIMQEYWHEENHTREYAALVCGKVIEPEGRIESWLKENANLQVYSSHRRDDGQYALTNYELVQQNAEYSLLKVIPETGRRNQIRVHLSDISFPIVGDRRYGKGQNPIGRLGLHATHLSFEHPDTGKIMSFDSPVPSAFYRMVKK